MACLSGLISPHLVHVQSVDKGDLVELFDGFPPSSSTTAVESGVVLTAARSMALLEASIVGECGSIGHHVCEHCICADDD